TAFQMEEFLASITGEKDLYFYDAIAPIVDADSIDRESAFLGNRYGKGEEAAYLNCPMTREEYYAFVDELLKGDTVPPQNFEKEIFFQGCQPIEAIAATGRETLRFGPLKPVGLDDPKTGRRPYAVLQLRPENKSLTAYNLVGFQTKLKWGEQSRLFKMIPALRNAEYFRMGSIHRNTYANSPRVLASDLSLKSRPDVFLSGQVTGVEGYLESSACGILAALSILSRMEKREFVPPPKTTLLGSLHHFLTESDPKHFSPMNACFALFERTWFDGVSTLKKDQVRTKMLEQSLRDFAGWRETQPARSQAMSEPAFQPLTELSPAEVQ
ncbi:MAG: methylenetetrahydrofolate--tRNA-(uracil(54)-C(5))-methyltransferase (FADH(2)-oxidizing) TrmFO, partial [Proteobacteria bacterium]